MAKADLDVIRTKVRRITRSPSPALLTNQEIDDRVNTFILYNFPSAIRLFSLRSTMTFYTQPNVDVYDLATTDPNNPLYGYQNKYIAIHPSVYLAGIQGLFTQWRDVFYGYYPQTNTIAMTGLYGNGNTGPFVGTLFAHPVLQNNVIFTCMDQNGNAMILVDYPVSNQMGALGLVNAPQVLPSPYGQINYVTGAFTATFPYNTLSGISNPLYSETIAYQPGKPLCTLYYDNKFTIRPVPDKVYAVQVEVDVQPTQLIEDTDTPNLNQWWQYIAYGTSLLVFQDRMDLESVQLIMPEFKNQESFVLRTALTVQANERTQTIYTQGKNYGFGWFGNAGWPY